MKKILETLKDPKILTILIIIIIFGLYLRAYHTDYPVIGYHNWKETHYLTEARNFARDGFFANGFFVPANDYPPLDGDPSGAHADTFPTISILVAFAFKIFGASLSAARWIGILFSLGSIFAMFLFTKELFKRDDIALIAAVLTALNPLLVFFSHNVQLMNPGLFFMLMGGYFYLRWRESTEKSDFIYTALFIALAGLTKYTFLVILLPIIFTFPYKKSLKELFDVKKYWLSYLLLLMIPVWIAYNSFIGKATGKSVGILSLIDLSTLSKVAWWASMRAYMLDNYAILGLLFALLGLLTAGYFYQKREKFGEQFLLGYALSALIFIIVLSEKVGGHSYHQFPIAPLFILLMAYSFTVLAGTFANMLGSKVQENKEKTLTYLKIGFVIFLLLMVYKVGGAYSSSNSIQRQFNTQFPGLDIAGEYINANSHSNERIIFSGGQSFGVLWHADRKGYYQINSVADIIKAENQGATWAFIYQWGLNDVGTEKWNYYEQNYDLAQLGFLAAGEGQQQLVYLLLKKGGTFDIDNLYEKVGNQPTHSKDYERTSGTYKFYYIDVE